MKIKLIANPTAGRNGLGKIQETVRLMTSMGAQVEVALTEYVGHAEELAAASYGFDRLVVAGGDGTVNEVINGMMPEPTPLAIIPQGTANVLALETDLPDSLVGQCENAVHGVIRQVNLGRAGERYFLLMAGAGFDAEIVRRVSLGTKRWLGKGAYLLSALKVLSHLSAPVNLRSDACYISNQAGVIVCNSRMYGGHFPLAPQASLFSPTFQVVVLPRRSSLGLLGLVLRSLLRGGLVSQIKVVETASVELSGAVALQLDGDSAGVLPCKIRSCPAALPMVLPA